MRFRERVLLAEAFDRWAEENNVKKSPLGVITFLDIKEALRKHGDCHPIRCKDCKIMERYTTAPEKYQWDGFCEFWARNTYDDYWCCGAERKEE